MIIVLSPAKALDYESRVGTRRRSEPAFIGDSERLAGLLKGFSPARLSRLMGISAQLGQLNAARYGAWRTPPYPPGSARQAMFAFKGDVYLGLDAYNFSAEDIDFAQKHLRILSGLYGVLRPLDLIQPYRLEMGTRLSTRRGADLYDFWGERPTQFLNDEFAALAGKSAKGAKTAKDTSDSPHTLVNLASNEYFKVLRPKALDAQVVTPVFKDYVNGQYRVVSFFAKKARGSMAAWIIRSRLQDAAGLVGFDSDGYRYYKAESSPAKPVFRRRKRA